MRTSSMEMSFPGLTDTVGVQRCKGPADLWLCQQETGANSLCTSPTILAGIGDWVGKGDVLVALQLLFS